MVGFDMFSKLSISLILAAMLFCHAIPGRAASEVTFPDKLIVTQSASYPPFAFINDRGEPTGYLIDLWNAFGRTNDIDIEFKLVAWNDSLNMVKNGQAHVHGGLFYNEERDRFLDYGPTVMEISTNMYASKGLSQGQINEETVGVIKGGQSEFFMQKERPETLIKPYSSTTDTIRAAKNGEIKVFISDHPTAYYHMQAQGITDLFDIAQVLYTKAIMVAVAEGDKATLQAIQAGWNNMDQSLINTIHNKWFVQDNPTPGWVFPGIVIAFAALILGLVIRKISRKVHKID